jgi:hypothetical protein
MFHFLRRVRIPGILGSRSKDRRTASRRGQQSFQPAPEPLPARVVLSSFRWIGPSSGDWDNAANWADTSGHPGIPGLYDTASIGIPTLTPNSIIVYHSATTADAVGQLYDYGSLMLWKGSLQIAESSMIGGGLYINQGATLTIRSRP